MAKRMKTENKYFMNESKSDVIFVVNGQRIPAIKVLLSMKSDVFEAMFSGEFRESNDKEIEIKDTTFDAFKAMIGFLYNNQLVLSPNNRSMAKEVYKLGHKYQIKELMDCAEEVWIPMIGFDTIEDMYKFATFYKTEKTIKALNQFIENNIDHYCGQSMAEIKRLNASTDQYLIEAIIRQKNKKLCEKEREIDGHRHFIEPICTRCGVYYINHKCPFQTFTRYN